MSKKRNLNRNTPRAARPAQKITFDALAASRVNPKKTQAFTEATFKRASPPPGVVPKTHNMAMDTGLQIEASAWAAQQLYNGAFYEGITFMGYPYLSELAQRPEYRRISEVIATEMTRKWIKFQATGDEDKTDRIQKLNDALDHLNVRQVFKRIAEQDGFFGRSHLYIDTGATDELDELALPIGNGRNDISKAKIGLGDIRALKVVEPVWTYPADYNSNDPLSDTWYKPESWFVQGKRVHSSRLLTFVGREVPDLLKPAYSFGGLSLSQMAKPYVDNWLRTRQSVSDMISAFSVMVLATDLSTMMQSGSDMFARLDLFNNLRDNRGAMVVNKDSEELTNVSAPLGGLEALQAQSQEHMCSVTGIPVVKLLGIQPAGLNASSEGELDSFAAWIEAFQESFFRQNLTKVIDFVQLATFGDVDPDITFKFEPLKVLSDLELATLQKTKADTGGVLVEGGIISPEEERARVAADPESGYDSIDPDDMPEPPAPEEGDLPPDQMGEEDEENVEQRAAA